MRIKGCEDVTHIDLCRTMHQMCSVLVAAESMEISFLGNVWLDVDWRVAQHTANITVYDSCVKCRYRLDLYVKKNWK